MLWKISYLVPISKKVRLSTSNDYRPVVLTSLLMKSLEKLELSHIWPLVNPSLDPLWFSCQPI